MDEEMIKELYPASYGEETTQEEKALTVFNW